MFKVGANLVRDAEVSELPVRAMELPPRVREQRNVLGRTMLNTENCIETSGPINAGLFDKG